MIFLREAAQRRRPSHHRLLCTAKAATSSFVLPLFILLNVLAPAISAQTPSAAADDDDVIRIRTDIITVPVFVTDAHGHRIEGLMQSDFNVLSDDRPVVIKYFAAGTTRVALLFALDDSGSTRDTIARQRETALALFSRFGSNSRIGILTFDEQSALTLPFTTDAERARAAFVFKAQPNRHTAIFDAALAAIRTFDRANADRLERRIVVLLSDGLDTASRTRPNVVINEAKARGVSFYVIHLPLLEVSDGRLTLRRPSKGFRELAEQTGGHFHTFGDARSSLDPHATYDLSVVFRAIAEDLQSQYVLGYDLEAAARVAGVHRIAVNLNGHNRRRLRVQTLRSEYRIDDK